MSRDKSKTEQPPAGDEPAAGAPRPSASRPGSPRRAPVDTNVTGRVKFDERGNAIWEWAGSNDPEQVLSLEDIASVENRKAPPHGQSPYDSKLISRRASEPKSKKTDLKRLSESLKLRQQANRKKGG